MISVSYHDINMMLIYFLAPLSTTSHGLDHWMELPVGTGIYDVSKTLDYITSERLKVLMVMKIGLTIFQMSNSITISHCVNVNIMTFCRHWVSFLIPNN